MNKKIENILLAAAFVAIVLYLVVQMLGGINFLSALKIGMALSPFLLALFAAYNSAWLGLAIGLLPLTYTIPLPLVSRFPGGLLFGLLLFGFIVAQSAIHKNRSNSVSDTSYTFMIWAGLLVFVRILVDRPGSARLGDTGGIGEAVMSLSAFAAYWAVVRLTLEDENPMKTLRTVFVLACILTVYHIFLIAPRGSEALFLLFHRSAWLLSALVFAWVLSVREKGRMTAAYPLLYVGSMGAILSASVLSAHRSRPLFAVALILAIAFAYRKARVTLVVLLTMSILGIGSMFVFFPSGVPGRIKRSLSTVVAITQSDFKTYAHQYAISDEVGWQSEFRSVMWNLAAKRIKQHPVLGNGFTFYLDDIIDELYSMTLMGRFQGLGALAMAGGYHNSVLALAVYCGIPVAFLFSFALLSTIYRFFRFLRTSADPDQRLFGASLMGFLMASSGQMLMNGGPFDMYVVSVLTAVMTGVLVKETMRKAAKAPEEAPKVRAAFLSMGSG